MSVARRFAVAFAVVGAGVLAYAVPASATGNDQDHHGGQCVDGTVAGNLDHHVNPDAGTATVEAEGTLCAPVDVILSIYNDGKRCSLHAPMVTIRTRGTKPAA